jgi:hypothetical protein
MKIHFTHSNQNKASVLLITLGVCAIMGIMVASYLTMSQTQRFSVARAQAWNHALNVAEAGVEEAMADLNDTNFIKQGSFGNLGGLGLAPNKWLFITNGVICKTNIYLGSNYYNVFMYTNSTPLTPTADSMHPVIISTGFVAGPISSPIVARAVRVQATPITQAVPDGAMVVTDTVNVSGFNVTTDSFQSTNLALFPGGTWNASNRMDHGDVSTLSTSNSALNIQNGKIRGSVHTPPSWTATSANVGAGGSIGDNAWVGGGTKGLEAGHAKNDAVQSYPDATLPDTGGAIWQPAVKGAYVVNGVTYDYLLTPAKPWVINNLNGSIYVKGTNVMLQLTGSSASIPSGGSLTVGTDAYGNASTLAMYVSATSFTVNGTGYVNEFGIAKNLQYYGLPSNTALTLGGNASFTAQIYAPEANFTLGGGGSTPYDFAGMCVTRSVKMNGHFNFHFDETTKNTLHLFGYTARSWDEL